VQHGARPPTELRRPATFQIRGVAPPFTTPLLAGARMRIGERSGLELLVANPSGNQGRYILPWAGIGSFCNPTVHDTILVRRISVAGVIDPATIRKAAQDVAIEGFAGPDAQGAALAARRSDDDLRALTHFLLLAELIEQIEPTGWEPANMAESTPAFDRRAELVLRRVAPSFGCLTADLAAGVAALAEAFVPIGIKSDDQAARVPRQVARLEATHADLACWLATDSDHDIGGLGLTVTVAMQAARDNLAAVLTRTRIILADPIMLLKRWISSPVEVLKIAPRCDWLLDGWEPVTLLWQTAASAPARRAALLEMTQWLPGLPLEVADWTEGRAHRERTDQGSRIISHNDAWRRGSAALALIQRNESLRALSL
jgi:hypothetical protein